MLTVEVAVPRMLKHKTSQFVSDSYGGVPFSFIATAQKEFDVECQTTVAPMGCTDEFGTATECSVTFEWTDELGSIDATVFETAKNSATIYLKDGIDGSTTYTNTLTILANSLTPATLTKLSCAVSSSSGASGYSDYGIAVNDIPDGGSCSLTPTTGNPVTTKFTVDCQGFSDVTSETLTYAVTAGLAGGVQTVVASDSKTAEATFIMDSAGQYTVTALVYDELGAVGVREMLLTVSDAAVTTSDVSDIRNTDIADSLATGDASKVFTICSALAKASAAVTAAPTIAPTASGSGSGSGSATRRSNYMSQHTSGRQLLSGRRLLSMTSTQTELLQDQTDASSTPVTTETEALSRMQSLYNTIHPYVNDSDFSQTDLSNSITVLESVVSLPLRLSSCTFRLAFVCDD